ncbi:hypothetical protein D3C86_2133750 [compost metagenome]
MEGSERLSIFFKSVNPKLDLINRLSIILYEITEFAIKSVVFARLLLSRFAKGFSQVLFSQFKFPY